MRRLTLTIQIISIFTKEREKQKHQSQRRRSNKGNKSQGKRAKKRRKQRLKIKMLRKEPHDKGCSLYQTEKTRKQIFSQSVQQDNSDNILILLQTHFGLLNSINCKIITSLIFNRYFLTVYSKNRKLMCFGFLSKWENIH